MSAVAKKSSGLPPLDEDGLLRDPQQWNETVAQLLADYYGVGALGTDHWQVISTLRAHYARFGAAPAMIQVCKLHGKDRHWVHDLFHTCSMPGASPAAESRRRGEVVPERELAAPQATATRPGIVPRVCCGFVALVRGRRMS